MIEGKIYTYCDLDKTRGVILLFAENNVYLLRRSSAAACTAPLMRRERCKTPTCFETPFYAELIKPNVQRFFKTSRTVWIEKIDPIDTSHFKITIHEIENDACPCYPTLLPIISDTEIVKILHEKCKLVPGATNFAYIHIDENDKQIITNYNQKSLAVQDVDTLLVPSVDHLFVDNTLRKVFEG